MAKRIDTTTKAGQAARRHDFVEARKIFKERLLPFRNELTPKEKGTYAPSTVWKQTFQRFERLIA